MICPHCSQAFAVGVIEPIHCPCGATLTEAELLPGGRAGRKSCRHRGTTERRIRGDALTCRCGDVALRWCELQEEWVSQAPIKPEASDVLQRLEEDYWGRSCRTCSYGPRAPLLPDETERRWRWISAAQFTADCRLLAAALPWPIRGVCGVPRGGVWAASMISSWLNVPLYALTDAGPTLLESSGRRLSESQFRGPLVVVDDDLFSGLTMREATAGLPCVTAAVYQWAGALHPADVCVRRLATTWLCEHRFFSSWTVPRTAFDFDGILCRDPRPDEPDGSRAYDVFLRDAEPLWLPRPQRVPLIVTARLERYRGVTQAWLARWGVVVDRLEMWPGRSEERTGEAVARWKADVWGKTPLTFFAESDPGLAQRLAGLVKRPVVCPGAGRVFGDQYETEPNI